MRKAAGILVVMLVVVGGYVALAARYQHTFYPGTRVANIDISNMSYGDATRLLQAQSQKLSQLPVSVVVPDPSKPAEPVTGDFPSKRAASTVGELGVTFNSEAALQDIWQKTHTITWNWPANSTKALVFGTAANLPFVQQMQPVTNFITLSINPLVPVPVQATLAVADSTISITPDYPGVTVNQRELAERMRSLLRTATDGDALTVLAPTQLSQASVTSSSLQSLANKLETLASIKLTLTKSGVVLSPSRAQQLSWYVPFQDDTGAVGLNVDTGKVSTYLRANSSIDAAASSATIASDLQAQITASTVATTVSSILTLLPTKQVQAGHVKLGLYSGKYIEINLAEQKLYRITGTSLEKVYRVSSGKSSTPTPRGAFTLSGHSLRPLSSLYGLYMPYWINFKDNVYGLHELPEWPNGYKEGQGHLGTPVSDGCVRLGIGDAKEIYNWTSDGTPLLID